MDDDFEFRIKRKKKVEVEPANLNDFPDKEKPKKKFSKMDRAERKRKIKAILPKYETDKVISRILEEATNNENYFKPMQLILTEGKKDLVHLTRP